MALFLLIKKEVGMRPSCYKLCSLRPEAVCWDMTNGIGGGEGARKRPEEVTLSREDGRSPRSAPDLGARAARIDFLYYQL